MINFFLYGVSFGLGVMFSFVILILGVSAHASIEERRNRKRQAPPQ